MTHEKESSFSGEMTQQEMSQLQSEKTLSTENEPSLPDNSSITPVIEIFNPGNDNDLTQVKATLHEMPKEKRQYPAERKAAPQWECPVCFKSMSSRGKAGHLEKVHGILKEHDPFPYFHRLLTLKRRPLSKADVRNLINNVFDILVENSRQPDIVQLRKAMFQCEYLIKELEIRHNCTLEEAWKKFPVQREEIKSYYRQE